MGEGLLDVGAGSSLAGERPVHVALSAGRGLQDASLLHCLLAGELSLHQGKVLEVLEAGCQKKVSREKSQPEKSQPEKKSAGKKSAGKKVS